MIAYTNISIKTDGEEFTIIGDQHPDYAALNIGIEDLTTKIAGQSIIATLRLKIPNIIIGNNSEIYTKRIKRLFDLRNTWRIDLNYGSLVSFANMRVFDTALEYSESIKGVEIDVTLHGALFSALNYIRLDNLNLTRESFLGAGVGTAMSLETVMTVVLNKAKEKIHELSNVSASQTIASLETTIELATEAQSDPEQIEALKKKVIDFRRIKDDEDALKNFDKDMIPNLDDIEIIVIAKDENVSYGYYTQGTETAADSEYRRVWTPALKETGVMSQILNVDSDARVSIAKFLEDLLLEQGLQLIQLPQFKNGTASPMMIIPLTAIAGTEYIEFVKKNGVISRRDNFVDKIDLLSVKNSILSVQASTTRGKESLQSVMQSEQIAMQNKDSANDGVQSKSIYNILEQTSKQISIESLGLPMLNYYNTYEIDFIGDMFSGKYKVIEFEHKISGNKFTTSFEAVRIASGSGTSYSKGSGAYNSDNSKKKPEENQEETNSEKRWFKPWTWNRSSNRGVEDTDNGSGYQYKQYPQGG